MVRHLSESDGLLLGMIRCPRLARRGTGMRDPGSAMRDPGFED